MKGAFEHHDSGFFNPTIVAVKTCEFYRRFIGLGSGIAEEAIVHACQLCQDRAQLLLCFNAIQVRGVHQFVGLLPNGGGNRRVRMAQSVDSNARNPVEIPSPLGIINVHAFSVTECHRQASVSLHQCRHGSDSPKNAKRQRELPQKE